MARRKAKKQAGTQENSTTSDATVMQGRLLEALPEALIRPRHPGKTIPKLGPGTSLSPKNLEQQLPSSAVLICKRVNGILVLDKLSPPPTEPVLGNVQSSINELEIGVLANQAAAGKKAAQRNLVHGTSVGQSENDLADGFEMQKAGAGMKYEVQKPLRKHSFAISEIDGPDKDQAIAGKNRSHSAKPLSIALETQAGQPGIDLAGDQSVTQQKKPGEEAWKNQCEAWKLFSYENHMRDKPVEPSVTARVDGASQQNIARRMRIDCKASKDGPSLTPIDTATGMIGFSARWAKDDKRETDKKKREAKAKELAKEAIKLSKRGDTAPVVRDWGQDVCRRKIAREWRVGAVPTSEYEEYGKCREWDRY